MWFLLTIDSVDLCSTLAVNWKQLWRNCVQPNVDACRYMPSDSCSVVSARCRCPQHNTMHFISTFHHSTSNRFFLFLSN
ncbi:Required for respiratory growth protein 1 [Trichinella spiralis]|uniref:Required for respiratory growth protein 1 n=1 Tax=Trichinella spiralis TaxID=6334 RepID=A0ABR3KUK9_TRISP